MTRIRLADQRGFTMAMVMGVMLIASIISVAAFQSVQGDMKPSGANANRRSAFTAAESGIAWYQAKLSTNPSYWSLCDTGRTNNVADPVNQPNVTAANRRWQTVSGTGAETADFSIGLLPRTAVSATCSTTSMASMFDASSGTFKVRSTGRYKGQLRTIVATFRAKRFLDYLYFTYYETLDPDINGGSASCANYRASRPSSCVDIQFADKDAVNGPLHTNDDLVYCGTPTFGRTITDKIEVSGPKPGYARNSNCRDSGTPSFVGTFAYGTDQLQMPPTNTGLAALTTAAPPWTGPGYQLTGTQYIRFNNNGTMTVDTPTASAPTTVNLPSNGVIYVKTSPTLGCTNGNTPQAQDYTEGSGCANVYVSGTIDQSVTIVSERDIIAAPTTNYTGSNTTVSSGSTSPTNARFVPNTTNSNWKDADLKVAGTLDSSSQQISGTNLIGLIATGNIRVYHRIAVSNNTATLGSGVRDVRIDAAILSNQHSFIVDNWAYGPPAGDLTVHGAIAQIFRGTVGTGSGATISSGYVKDYWYDDRLKYASPPYFVDPVNNSWTAAQQTELVPPV